MSLTLCDCMKSLKVSLLLLTRGAETVNAQNCEKACYLTRQSSLTESCHIQSSKFREILKNVGILIWLNSCDENHGIKYSRVDQIKFVEDSHNKKILFSLLNSLCQIFRKYSFFSSTDQVFDWLIDILRVNRMLITSFWFQSKLVLEKLSNITINCKHCFFKIFHTNFSKREFLWEVFKWTFCSFQW